MKFSTVLFSLGRTIAPYIRGAVVTLFLVILAFVGYQAFTISQLENKLLELSQRDRDLSRELSTCTASLKTQTEAIVNFKEDAKNARERMAELQKRLDSLVEDNRELIEQIQNEEPLDMTSCESMVIDMATRIFNRDSQ